VFGEMFSERTGEHEMRRVGAELGGKLAVMRENNWAYCADGGGQGRSRCLYDALLAASLSRCAADETKHVRQAGLYLRDSRHQELVKAAQPSFAHQVNKAVADWAVKVAFRRMGRNLL
jgi:hypothetical protein